MTSRRKQFKPTKANSDVDQISVTENVNKNVTTFPIMSPLINENKSEAMEQINENVEYSSTDEENNNILQIVTNCSTKSSTDPNKKAIPKDDAKIVPFETVNGIDIFQCPLCLKSAISGRESLTNHLQDHQNRSRREDGKHICCLCSKELSSNSSLERHLLTHSNHRPFSCNLCDKKFTTNGNLSRHIKTSHHQTHLNDIPTNNNVTTTLTSYTPITHSTSIDSSIDEVIKKHKAPSLPPPPSAITNNNNNINNNLSIQTNSLPPPPPPPLLPPAQPSTSSSSSSSIITMSSLSSPLKTSINTISPNISFMPPFLSMNLADLTSILHSQLPTNLYQNNNNNNSSNNNNLLSYFNNINLNHNFKTFNRVNTTKIFENKQNKLSYKISHKIFQKWIQRKKYNQKISCYLKKYNGIKYQAHFKQTNKIQCFECKKHFYSNFKIRSHTKKCCSKSSILFCPFQICNRRFNKLNKLMNHLKSAHKLNVRKCVPIGPFNDEPLNLSMKKEDRLSSASSASSFPLFQFNNSTNYLFPQETLAQSMNTSNFPAYFNPHSYQMISPNLSLQSQLNNNPSLLSTCNLIRSFSNHSSLPMKSEPSFHHHNKEHNATTSSDTTSTSSKNSYLKTNNNNNVNMNNIQTNNCNSMIIKKKNSYKDAPKLITCPMEGCAQKFPWNSSLMRHILTHTSHKPFKCTRCTKSFSTKSNRERHMTRVHGVRINRSKFKQQISNTLSPTQDPTQSHDPIRSLSDQIIAPPSSLISSSTIVKLESTVDDNTTIKQYNTNSALSTFTELSEEEWMLMDNSDRQAEDISSNLLKLAGQPIVEPNPIRLSNNISTSISNNTLSNLFHNSRNI